MLFVALGIRIYDLGDPPFDFHPTRQFFTAIVARGEYYQGLTSAPEWMREAAIAHWKVEETDFPTIDLLAAWTYRLIGHEDIFYPRFYSLLFWIIGGLAVFFLGRDLVSVEGGITALGFYLFLPYGVIASRSFQPDPLMVCIILFAWWSMFRWKQTNKWVWAIVAGLLSGAAMLTKVLAAFSLLGGMAGVFFAGDLRKSVRNLRFWIMGLVAATPMVAWIYYGFFIRSTLGGQFSLRFFPNLLIDPVFYIRMEGMVERVVGLIPLILAFLGVFLYEKGLKRTYIFGLWSGYFVFALVFSYYFMTHDYYHITLIPIIALSLAPVGELAFRQLEKLNPGRISRGVVIVLLLTCFGANLWDIRQTLHKEDHRKQAAMLEHVGTLISKDASVVALTSDYGLPLFYYSWISSSYWPYTGDIALRELAGLPAPEFSSQFNEMTEGKQYFLITDLDELEQQSDLKAFLSDHYQVFGQGDSYIIYDLLSPKTVP